MEIMKDQPSYWHEGSFRQGILGAKIKNSTIQKVWRDISCSTSQINVSYTVMQILLRKIWYIWYLRWWNYLSIVSRRNRSQQIYLTNKPTEEQIYLEKKLTPETLIWSSSRRLLLLASSSFFHSPTHSFMLRLPPYSLGRTLTSTTLLSASRLEWVWKRFLIFSERRLLAKAKMIDMVQGRLRKWISRWRIGRARSQHENALDTSDGVHSEIWFQLTACSSMTYVKPRTWFSSLLSRVSKVMMCMRIMSLVVNLAGSKALALEKMTRRPCASRSGRVKM